MKTLIAVILFALSFTANAGLQHWKYAGMGSMGTWIEGGNNVHFSYAQVADDYLIIALNPKNNKWYILLRFNNSENRLDPAYKPGFFVRTTDSTQGKSGFFDSDLNINHSARVILLMEPYEKDSIAIARLSDDDLIEIQNERDLGAEYMINGSITSYRFPGVQVKAAINEMLKASGTTLVAGTKLESEIHPLVIETTKLDGWHPSAPCDNTSWECYEQTREYVFNDINQFVAGWTYYGFRYDKKSEGGWSYKLYCITGSVCGVEDKVQNRITNLLTERWTAAKAASDKQQNIKYDSAKVKIRDFTYPSAGCGSPKKIGVGASDHKVKKANRINENWYDCMNTAWEDDDRAFRKLIDSLSDAGGEWDWTNRSEGRYEWWIDNACEGCQKALLQISAELVQRQESRNDATDAMNDWIDARNSRQEDKDSSDAMWDGINEALDRSQREMDEMYRQRQEWNNNQIYHTPGLY